MKRRPLLLALAAAAFLPGCHYLRDRGRDLADVVTVAATTGIGVTAQVLPIVQGLGFNERHYGLEDGQWIAGHGGLETCLLVTSMKAAAGDEEQAEDTRMLALRGKDYESTFLLGIYPMPDPPPRLTAHFYGKVEIAASLGVGAKIGLNVVELFDFLTGIFGWDPLRDDLTDQAER